VLIEAELIKINPYLEFLKVLVLAGISPGVELLNLDNDGNLSVTGTISNVSGSIDGGSF
jgi:hypothetical protein